MGKLIELEWRKNRIGNWVRWAALLGAALGLLIFAMAFLGIANDPKTGVPDAAPGHGGISSPIELLTSMCFLVFTGVMLSVFIVGAYQNGTMSLVFSYPGRRQKLLAAQMLAVWIFCFGALAAAKLLLYGCVLAGSRFLPSAFPLDFDMTRGAFYGQLLLRSAVTVTEGFIALFAGLALHSARAAIVTSFLLVLLTQGNIGSFTMADSAVFPAVLTGISLLCVLLSLRGAETRRRRPFLWAAPPLHVWGENGTCSGPAQQPAMARARSRMVPAASSLDMRGSSSAPSAVMRVSTLVSTPKPAPATFRLLAQIMSTFFFSSLARLFSTMSRVSMEKPQMNWPGRRCSPR